jgi:hypothetical protein
MMVIYSIHSIAREYHQTILILRCLSAIIAYTHKTSCKQALMFLQRKLSDAMNPLGEIPWKGLIREDPAWSKQFRKDMLVKVASSKEAQVSDLPADMDHQISLSDQPCLVAECCYDYHVITNLVSAIESPTL